VIKTSTAIVYCGIYPRSRALGRYSTECLRAVLTCRSVGLQFRMIAAFITKPLRRVSNLCTTNSQSTATVPSNTKSPCIATAVLEVEEARYNYRPWTKLRRGLHRFEWIPSQDTEDKSPFCIAHRHLGPNRSALRMWQEARGTRQRKSPTLDG
jgi:hypothetical protein